MKIASRLMLGATLLTALAVVGSAGTTGWLALNHSSLAVETALQRQFQTTAAGREDALVRQFESFRELLQSQAHNRMTQEALYGFVRPFDSYRYEVPATDAAALREQLGHWYQHEYIPFHWRSADSTPDWQNWLDSMAYEALLLQHYYLQTNPGGPGALQLMEDRQDGTIYSQQHRRYHASFRDLVERFGFSDLMLLDHQGERVIYSVRKGPHLGTSLKTGPFQSSALAALVRQLREHPPATPVLSGLAPSPFHNDRQVLYLGLSVIHDQLSPEQPTGYLVVEIPAEQLTQSITLDGQWQSLGLGETGQAYLVAPDGNLATRPRDGHPVPQARVLEPVRAALRGDRGLGEALDNQGEMQLYAWQPVSLGGQTYALIVQQSPAEVFSSVRALRTTILSSSLSSSVVLIALALLGAWGFARLLSRPLIRLAEQIDRAAREHDLTLSFDGRRDDEIGAISRSLSALFERLRGILAEVAEATQHAADTANTNATISAQCRAEVHEQSQGMNALDNAIEQTGLSLETISDELEVINQRGDEAAGFAEQGRAQVADVARQVEQLRAQIMNSDTSMTELTRAADAIVAVVDTIKSVAEQTNLLALNAAIEAARAGEQGRGFTVVAGEVRRLSAHTQDATGEIQTLVDHLRETVALTAAELQAEQHSAQICMEQSLLAEAALGRIHETVVGASRITQSLQTRSKDERQRANALRQHLQEMLVRVGETDRAIIRLTDSATSQRTMTERTLALTRAIKV